VTIEEMKARLTRLIALCHLLAERGMDAEDRGDYARAEVLAIRWTVADDAAVPLWYALYVDADEVRS
jgi:hypothetical protein